MSTHRILFYLKQSPMPIASESCACYKNCTLLFPFSSDYFLTFCQIFVLPDLSLFSQISPMWTGAIFFSIKTAHRILFLSSAKSDADVGGRFQRGGSEWEEGPLHRRSERDSCGRRGRYRTWWRCGTDPLFTCIGRSQGGEQGPADWYERIPFIYYHIVTLIIILCSTL